MLRPAPLALFLVLLPGAPAAVLADDHPLTQADVKAPVQWGGLDVVQVRHLYFAGQPTQATLEEARDAGIELVINLRTPQEIAALDFDTEAAAEGLGMRYANVPVGKPPFSAEAFEQVEALVAEAGEAPVLIHCASSQRAGGWLAVHAVTRHGVEVDQALQLARMAGVRSPQVEQGVRDLLAEREKPAE